MTRLIALVSLVIVAETACADWNWKDNGGAVYQAGQDWSKFRYAIDSTSEWKVTGPNLYCFGYDETSGEIIKVQYKQDPWKCERVEIRQDYIKSIRFEDGKMVVEIKEPKKPESDVCSTTREYKNGKWKYRAK